MAVLLVGLGAHVMKARHWMVAGLIALAGMGNVMASDLDRQDQGAAGHGTMDNSAHDSGSAGGDTLLSARDGGASRRATDTDGTAETERHGGGGSDRSGQASSSPTSARPTTIGWQSLLPGSIQ